MKKGGEKIKVGGGTFRDLQARMDGERPSYP